MSLVHTFLYTCYFQLLRQEVNQGVTYSYTIPARDLPPASSAGAATKHRRIPLPELPSEEDDMPASSDQATNQQSYYNYKAEKRPQSPQGQGTQQHSRSNQYSRTANADRVHHQKSSQSVGNSYTNSQLSVSSNQGYNYIVNPYRNRYHKGHGNMSQAQSGHRHRHQRNRQSRSHRREVKVQATPQRRYDLQALANSHSPANQNQPHIISALTPEGQRRYQYASQQAPSSVYPNAGGYPSYTQPSPYIQPQAGQGGHNPNLAIQGPSLGQYGSYYQPINRGRYSDPVSLGRTPLNDQISLTLPDSGLRQIGNVHSANDYSWRISGFTECTQTCGGGLYVFSSLE